jgi:hypothetical protein
LASGSRLARFVRDARAAFAATAGRKGAFGGAENALALRHAAGFLEALDAFFHALIEAAAWPEPGTGLAFD